MDIRKDAAGYDCEDRSFLYPLYRRLLWQPIVNRLPAGWSANTISLSGTLASLVAAVVLLLMHDRSRPGFVLGGLLIFYYLCADNIDGLHARRTGRSSPMGEFLDHWLDGFNSGFLVLGFCYSIGYRGDYLVAAMAVSGLGFFATVWEQRVTGRIFLGRMGSVEGITGIVLFYFLFAIFGFRLLGERPLVFSLTLVSAWYWFAMAGYATTVVRVVLRVRSHLRDWGKMLLVTALPVAWYFAGGRGESMSVPLAFLLVFTSCFYGGRQILVRLSGTTYPRDHLLVAYLLLVVPLSLLLRLDATTQLVLVHGALLMTLAYLVIDFMRTGRELKHHLSGREIVSLIFR